MISKKKKLSQSIGKENDLPSRWIGKQFAMDRHPKHAENGYFTKLECHSEPYTENIEKYSLNQKLVDRKLGFGSRDAFKRDEFSSTKAAERYRDTIKREIKLINKHRDLRKEEEMIKEYQVKKEKSRLPCDKKGVVKSRPEFLFDIVCGTNNDSYDPSTKKDSFYQIPKHAPVYRSIAGQYDSRRLASHKPESVVIGSTAWLHKSSLPTGSHGYTRGTLKFYDAGHLRCNGF